MPESPTMLVPASQSSESILTWNGCRGLAQQKKNRSTKYSYLSSLMPGSLRCNVAAPTLAADAMPISVYQKTASPVLSAYTLAAVNLDPARLRSRARSFFVTGAFFTILFCFIGSRWFRFNFLLAGPAQREFIGHPLGESSFRSLLLTRFLLNA